MMKMCPKCGCDLERYEENEMESDEMESDGMVVSEIELPADKQAAIKSRLREIGKMLASVVEEED